MFWPGIVSFYYLCHFPQCCVYSVSLFSCLPVIECTLIWLLSTLFQLELFFLRSPNSQDKLSSSGWQVPDLSVVTVTSVLLVSPPSALHGIVSPWWPTAPLSHCADSAALFILFPGSLLSVLLLLFVFSLGCLINIDAFFVCVIKYLQHKICHFNSFSVQGLVGLSTYTLLCDYHHRLFPELFHLPQMKLCTH